MTNKAYTSESMIAVLAASSLIAVSSLTGGLQSLAETGGQTVAETGGQTVAETGGQTVAETGGQTVA